MSRLHHDPRLEHDDNGRNIELERFVYYSDASERHVEQPKKEIKVRAEHFDDNLRNIANSNRTYIVKR